MNEINAQYNVAKADSLPVRIAAYQRRRMFETFLVNCGLPNAERTILDVGATSDQTYSASNYLEAWYPHKERITAAGIDEGASFLADTYPGLIFVQCDALDLPFENRSFDVVHSSAVIEHVGSFERQTRLIEECARVADRCFFITTPNRWFPIEFHTVLPLVHWLPKATFRRLMRATGREFFSEESNLNLMSRGELLRAVRAAALVGFEVRIESVGLGGWPSNLLVTGRRNSAEER